MLAACFGYADANAHSIDLGLPCGVAFEISLSSGIGITNCVNIEVSHSVALSIRHVQWRWRIVVGLLIAFGHSGSVEQQQRLAVSVVCVTKRVCQCERLAHSVFLACIFVSNVDMVGVCFDADYTILDDDGHKHADYNVNSVADAGGYCVCDHVCDGDAFPISSERHEHRHSHMLAYCDAQYVHVTRAVADAVVVVETNGHAVDHGHGVFLGF